MSKKDINVVHELKMSALSAERVTEHTGQIYASIAKLYAAAEGNKTLTSEIDVICHNLGLDYQDFQANSTRVKIMSATIDQKTQTIAELTEEVRSLQKILTQIQTAGEGLVSIRRNGRR